MYTPRYLTIITGLVSQSTAVKLMSMLKVMSWTSFINRVFGGKLVVLKWSSLIVNHVPPDNWPAGRLE